jgi:CHAT domain-containing protein/tetratricopeptide (TPR) repeat protein
MNRLPVSLLLGWMAFAPRQTAPEPVAALATELGIQLEPQARFSLLEHRGPTEAGSSKDEWTRHRPTIGRIARIAAEIERAARERPSAETLLELGTLRVVQGRHDEAVAAFERAVASPTGKRVRSDLAAALLVRSAARDDPVDLVRAASVSLEARESSEDERVLFNLALALDSLHLADQAAEVWNTYLELDDASPWAHEARRHLAAAWREGSSSGAIGKHTTEPTLDELLGAASRERVAIAVAGSPAKSLDWVLRELLADAPRVEEARADPTHSRWSLVADELVEVAGDHTLRDALDAMIRAWQVESGEKHRTALRDLARGIWLRGAGRCPEAEPLLASARVVLEEALSPLAEWAALHQSICIYFEDRAEAGRQLRSLIAAVDEERHPLLAGRVHWMAGLSTAGLAEGLGAIESYRRAIDRFSRASDPQEVASVRLLLAGELSVIGRIADAWRLRHRALAYWRLRPPSLERHRLLDEATRELTARGWSRLAIVFGGELVANASALSIAGLEPDALRRLAEARLASGDRTGAEAAALRGIAHAERLPSGGQGEAIHADLRRVLGSVRSETKTAEAVGLLSSAIEGYRRQGRHLPLLAALASRAAAHAAAGTFEAAAADLTSARELIERRLQDLGRAERWSYVDSAASTFDDLVRARLHAGDPGGALETADRRRQQELWEPMPRASSSTVETMVRRLRHSACVLEHSSDSTATHLFLVCADGVHHASSAVTRQELAARIDELVTLIEGGADWAQVRKGAADLYELLIAPHWRRIAGIDRLVVIPDRVTAAAPFPLLWNELRGSHLIEEVELSLAPSVRWLASQSGRREDTRPRSALVAGRSRALESELPALLGADRENRRIASVYADTMHLHDDAATPERVLQEIEARDVLHFAVHATAGAEIGVAELRLHPGPAGAAGTLPLTRLGQRLSPGTLVFLAACHPQRDPLDPSRRGLDLVASLLLSADGSAMVANAFAWDDVGSQDLAVGFHRAYRRTGRAAAALREAQLARLRSAESPPPRSWAGLQLWTAGEIFSEHSRQGPD